ncbi:hypothetical protein CK203_109594 [Vitis vinifera]|uniref:Uncharacterized protein n=1 Tax=Vitis vinifera TaxID=29760 RepID=A0A438CFT7_VITVI|nr:hypothetical protein CK203_109594 [Vitis vinifera]
MEGASAWDAPRRRGLLLWPAPLDYGLPHPFEEKVHRKKLQRVDTIPLLFPRLLCQILEYLGFPIEPQLKHRPLFRERFTLNKWNQLVGYSVSPGVPPMVAPPEPPQLEHREPRQRLHHQYPTPEATFATLPTTPTVPPVVPTTSEPSITISSLEFCVLLQLTTLTVEVRILPSQDEPPTVTATPKEASSPPEAPTA